ncbi:putative DNA-binding domain-containing protein [Rosistilla oblonga]|uniref:HvfC/BufC family peptide modification chaperone n=1 Tax=Rosistilla oblonga TaxID=2527990 RepID=UPI003A97DB15
MESQSRGLQSVQQWMQAVITHPDGVQNGSQSETAQDALGEAAGASLEDLILPSQRLDSQQRIEVYANAYYARLLECLSEEFPALVKLLGEETFNAFAVEYLQFFPSQSYTLADLGANFHHFLSQYRDAAQEDADSDSLERSWSDLMIDLAQLERTYSEVFSGPGIEQMETLRGDALATVPPQSMGSICLTPAPCLRLLQLNSAAHEYAIAVRKQTDLDGAFPEMRPTYLAITRIRYVVRTIELEPGEFEILQQLCEGVSLEAAIANVAALDSLDDTALAQRLLAWFQKWATDQMFVDFHVAAS